MTQTFGSRDLAREIYSHHYHRGRYDPIPEGWQRLGNGTYRTAYLHIATNLVYKCGTYWCNVAESATARKLRTRKHPTLNIRIPRTTTYRMPDVAPTGFNRDSRCRVVVQEYAEGAGETYCTGWDGISPCDCNWSGGCYQDLWSDLSTWSGLSDMHHENIRHNKTTDEFWIIDLAC